MHLKLKEDPKEWMKFTAAVSVASGLVVVSLGLRGMIGVSTLRIALVFAATALMVCLARPHWFRPFYRAGMTFSFHLGQVMGRGLLTIFFIVVLLPAGLLMRLLGMDLLKLKRDRSAPTYWHPARTPGRLDRLF